MFRSLGWVMLVTLLALTPSSLVAQQSCISCTQYSVLVTPAGNPVANYLNSSPDTVVFTVNNTGTANDFYNFSCSATGGIGCISVIPTSASISAGHSTTVKVVYSVGSSVGNVDLTAADDQLLDQSTGWYAVGANPTITLVVPVLSSGSRALVHTRQPIVRALFTTNGSGIDTTKTVLKFRTDTVTTFARANRGLIEWDVDSTRWINVGDSAQILVTACALNGLCTTATRWAVLANDSTPVLGFTGMPLEALGRQFAAPFGPGVAVSGGEIETGIGIPAYISLGVSRSAGLVYSTRQSYPRVLVPVDLELTWPTGNPDQIKVILYDGATKLDSLVQSTPTCATGSTRRCRAVLQGDFSASAFNTPTRKWLTVEARITSGAMTKIGTDSVEVVLVDRRTTPYGSGWWPSGMLKLVAAGSDRVLVGPSGTAVVYRGNGDTLFLPPPGDFSALVKFPNGSPRWELHQRGSSGKATFDTLGRIATIVDQNHNTITFVYNGTTDQIASITDPVNKSISFAYDGNGKLSTLTDPGSRQSKVVINNTTNQLTYDSIASPSSRPMTTGFAYQTYSGVGTLVLTKFNGVIGDTTVVTYDSTFRRRPVSSTLALVDTGGGTAKPVINYRAYEREGYGSVVSLDSVYVELKDPRNNWTRSLLNRWGEARKTWDALGLIGKTEYTPEGFVLWSEGKVADSSRVYSTYDARRRPSLTYIKRSATDSLTLSELVYDANDRVIAQIDKQRQEWDTYYDTVGNVIATKSPHGDSTRYWVHSDGVLDSLRLPSRTASQRFTYDATWRNLNAAYDESGHRITSNAFDGFGRTVDVQSYVWVEVTGTSGKCEWRRVQTAFAVNNQTDSTLLSHSVEAQPTCADVLWPDPSDTVLTQRVTYRYDRAGRDSLRLNDRQRGCTSTCKGVLYLYDRLGRLVSRRPWSDSSAVRDSFVYDIAGNVKKTITRRGDTLTTNYDSRNRDTLSVIPGVGTLRKQFAGPGDQLTRLWYDNPVDSIGGVNAELRWGFDQRGRLKADTNYTGTTARGSSYGYDTFERRTTTTDPLGTWTLHFEGRRSYPDTLFTPLGDTISYVYDSLTRPIGPTIQSGGKAFWATPGWSSVGELKTVVDSATDVTGTPTSYPAGRWDRQTFPDSAGPAVAPQWTEHRGKSTTADTYQDSVAYDGWERVTAFVVARAGTVVARDTFRFDRTGNLKTTAGAEVYDVTTDRLTSTASCSSLSYDRAGNLTSRTCSGNTWTYQYDALNQLRSVRYNGTLMVRYGYDVTGRRIAKRVYSSTTGGTVGYTRFVYRAANVGFETDSGGTIGLRYTYGPAADDLLAIDDGSNHYYVIQDRLHNVRGLLKRDGTWIRSLRYGPYGAVLADTSASGAPAWELRYRWTGRELDTETGFYFFRARYFDPGVRRFVQEDPIGFSGGSNVYAYGNGGPLEGRDPGGTDYAYENQPRYWLGWGEGGAPHEDSDWSFVPDGHGGGGWLPNDVINQYGASFLLQEARNANRAMAERSAAGRHLTPEQREALGNFCSLKARACDTAVLTNDCRPVSCGGAEALTWGGGINFGKDVDLSSTDPGFIAVLAHELTHVTQWLEDPLGYDLSMMWTWSVGLVFNGDPYALPDGWQGRSFSSFSREQQGIIVQRCYEGSADACGVSPYHP